MFHIFGDVNSVDFRGRLSDHNHKNNVKLCMLHIIDDDLTDLFHWSSWTCPSCRICEVIICLTPLNFMTSYGSLS